MKKSLIQVSVATMIEAEEAVAALVERLFHQTPVLYTNEETLITHVSVYLEDRRKWTDARRARLERGLARIRADGLAMGPGRIRARRLRLDDWAESWKRHFRPLEVGPTLLVKPPWSRRRPRPGQAEVILDPGLSFGTGQHPTTLFCLQQLAAGRGAIRHRSLLDIGTGSGILAIAAAKLGYRPIVAFDFDPVAVKNARANARSNGVAACLQIARGDVARPPLAPRAKFHVVCANLLADLLISEAHGIARRVRPDGHLVLAGILDREFARVRGVYEALGLKLAAEAAVREWHSGTFCWTFQKI